MQQMAKLKTNYDNRPKKFDLTVTLLAVAFLLCCQKLTTVLGDVNDPCTTKSQPGLCKQWSDCPVIRALIDSGEYNKREVVSCGFEVREELICCPNVRTTTKIEVTTGKNVETTTQRDFWLDVLEELKTSSTTTTTTPKPDFWLHLLSSTTTTTTTPKPLIVGDKRLDESSEFYDFSQLLSGKAGNQRREVNSPGNVDITFNNNNGPKNLNTGPVNINQWNLNGQQNFVPNTNNRRGLPAIEGKENNGHINGGAGRGPHVNFHNNKGPNFNGNLQTIVQDNAGGNDRGSLNLNYNHQNTANGQGARRGGVGPYFNNNFRNNGPGRGVGPYFNNNIRNNGQVGDIGPYFSNGQGRGFHSNGNGNGKGNGRGNPNFYNNFQNMGQLLENTEAVRDSNFNNNFQNNGKGTEGPGRVPNLNNNFQNNLHLNGAGGGSLEPSMQNSYQFQTSNQGISYPLNNPGKPIYDQNMHAPEVHKNQHVGPQPNTNDLINRVFKTPENSNINPNAGLTNVDEVIWNIFNEQHDPPASGNTGSPTVLWLNNPEETEGHAPFLEPKKKQPFQQINLASGPLIIEENDLETAASNHYVEAVQHLETTTYNPIQIVFDKLVDSGMEIVKATPVNDERAFKEHHQHHFGHQANQPHQKQQIVNPPNNGQQFGSQTLNHQFLVAQQPRHPPHFERQPMLPTEIGQQPTIQYEQQPMKDLQPTGQQIHPGTELIQSQSLTQPVPQLSTPNKYFQSTAVSENLPDVQSPPVTYASNVDPFKPFEFRPPPDDEVTFMDGDNLISPNPNPQEVTPATGNRPAARACQRILKNLYRGLSPHILGGTPAELGEFPHMAAIGYSRLGDDGQGPYDIRCGGSLIDDRFVLTAAHCVAARDSVPAIVRMGVVNFTDPIAMQDAVEIKIKQVFIHDDYAQKRTYNDIAVLELERPAPLGEFIQPVCLYTDLEDPDNTLKLYVTGWGTINTATRAFSDILLKARLQVTPITKCNESFVNYGLTRQINEGIIKTQLCAEDVEQIRDACQGDSGGPLNLVVDEAYKNYRLVGVVSSGFGCASSTPGLYTRVAAFLDFIERIVWPNGGD